MGEAAEYEEALARGDYEDPPEFESDFVCFNCEHEWDANELPEDYDHRFCPKCRFEHDD